MSAISILEALIRRETEARNAQEAVIDKTAYGNSERVLAIMRRQKHTAAIDVLREALNAIEAEACDGGA